MDRLIRVRIRFAILQEVENHMVNQSKSKSARVRNVGTKPASEEPQITAAKVMVIDDEPINAKIARTYMSTYGFSRFISITNPLEALESAMKERPGIILLDRMMPEMDGVELLKQFRETKELSHTPIIVLTAMDSRSAKQDAFDAGATDFLSKPFDPYDLILRVRNALIAKAHLDSVHSQANAMRREIIRLRRVLEEAGVSAKR